MLLSPGCSVVAAVVRGCWLLLWLSHPYRACPGTCRKKFSLKDKSWDITQPFQQLAQVGYHATFPAISAGGISRNLSSDWRMWDITQPFQQLALVGYHATLPASLQLRSSNKGLNTFNLAVKLSVL